MYLTYTILILRDICIKSIALFLERFFNEKFDH